MAIAMRASVTVSMAEAMIGMFSVMLRVMRERMSTSDGSTSDRPGCSNTSSKVSASRGLPLGFAGIAKLLGSRTAGMQTSLGRLEKPDRRSSTPVRSWRRSIARLRRDS